MNLRITQGIFKNKKIDIPNSAKPLRERVKLAVFSIIGDKIINAKCLDLFAGSGNLGIEAVSRGADSCTFVDNDYNAIKSILNNIANLNIQDDKHLLAVKDEATKYVSNDATHYDVIFMDPPYDLPVKHVLKMIDTMLNKSGIIIYFRSKNNLIDVELENPNLKIIDSRKYGITRVDFIHRK